LQFRGLADTNRWRDFS